MASNCAVGADDDDDDVAVSDAEFDLLLLLPSPPEIKCSVMCLVLL